MTQDFQAFLAGYRERHPDDVLVLTDPVPGDQVLTTLVQQLQGTIDYEDNAPGVRAVVSAPIRPRA